MSAISNPSKKSKCDLHPKRKRTSLMKASSIFISVLQSIFLFPHETDSFLTSWSPSKSILHNVFHDNRHQLNSIQTSLTNKLPLYNYRYSLRSQQLLATIQKEQNVIYDGSEFVSILSHLVLENNMTTYTTDNDANKKNQQLSKLKTLFPDLFDDDESTSLDQIDLSPKGKKGYLTFVVTTIDKNDSKSPTNYRGKRIIGVAKRMNQSSVADDVSSDFMVLDDPKQKNSNTVLALYKDSIAIIPTNNINDADAISTASAALSGIHIGLPYPEPSTNSTVTSATLGTTVILGGGDYACFLAKGLSHLGATVHLVTTRPMSLKNTPLNPLRNSDVIAMNPVVVKEETAKSASGKKKNDEDDEIGFSQAIGTFQTLIDTLGDEARLNSISNVQSGIDKFIGNTIGVASKLKSTNQCHRYISTLTESQSIVLSKGILFARDPVLQYQKSIEQGLLKQITPNTKERSGGSSSSSSSTGNKSDDSYMELVPPINFGDTLQKLFDGKIIFPTDRNENGSHRNKQAFVRGCSFPDYGEMEIWPRSSKEGSTVRYGFPGIDDISLEAKMQEMMKSMGDSIPTSTITTKKENPTSVIPTDEDNSENTVGANSTSPVSAASTLTNSDTSTNPFVQEFNTLSEIKEAIVQNEKDCVLFISAPYCKLCKAITPQYTRLARIYKEENNSNLVFAKASTKGKAGKQLTFTFNVDTVPSFILFKKGKKFGNPIGVPKLPSKKLDLAIQYIEEDKEWDDAVFLNNNEENLQQTKIR